MKNQIVLVKGKPGEYTGYSDITGKHYVSMYDGTVKKLTPEQATKAGIIIHASPSQ